MLATTHEKLIDLLEKISSGHDCADQKHMIRSLKHGLWASGQELAWADVTGWDLDQIQDHLADELRAVLPGDGEGRTASPRPPAV